MCLSVAGSPFMFTVGPFGEGGAHKVHAGGPGLERGEVKQPGKTRSSNITLKFITQYWFEFSENEVQAQDICFVE